MTEPPRSSADPDVERLFDDPSLPVGPIFRSSGHAGVVYVRTLVERAREAGLASEGEELEARLDAFIEGIGGRRSRNVDVSHLTRRLIRRLRGKPGASTEVYILPATFVRTHRIGVFRPRDR